MTEHEFQMRITGRKFLVENCDGLTYEFIPVNTLSTSRNVRIIYNIKSEGDDLYLIHGGSLSTEDLKITIHNNATPFEFSLTTKFTKKKFNTLKEIVTQKD